MSAPMQTGFVDNALPTESGKPPVWSYNMGVRVQLQCSDCRTEMKNKSRADVFPQVWNKRKHLALGP